MKIKRGFALFYFLLFSAVIIGAYLYYRPSWGVMDDWQHIQSSHGIWANPNKLQNAILYIKGDFLSQKIRPLYCIYYLLVYKIFYNFPFMLYILIFLAQMSILPLWGFIFHKMFCGEEKISGSALFIFPLSFFLFTPFWNNFMYVSLQEKFIFYFSAFSIYFLLRAYEKGRISYLAVSLIFNLLCLLSKPTGIFIILSFLAFSLIHIVFLKKNRLLSFVSLLFNALLITAYYLLIRMYITPGGYSFKYIKNFSILGVIGQVLRSPLVIKSLFIFSVFYLVLLVILIRKKIVSFTSLLLPVCFISYILILAPWGIMNYFLAPVTPFIFGMLFLFYYFCVKQLKKTRLNFLPDALIVLFSAVILAQVIMPRIIKIADIKNAESKIVDLKTATGQCKFYFPPPYLETHFALSKFTNTDIAYLHAGVLTSDMLLESGNYLIYTAECASIELKDVKVAQVVYENNTWKIFEVVKEEGERKTLLVSFPKTLLLKFITYLRDRV